MIYLIPCLLQNEISLDENYHQDPKKCQDILWHQKYFLMKINSSPTPRKINTGPCGTFINKQWYKKRRLEIRPCWVPNPQQGVATVTMEAKRTLSLSISHVPKIGTTTCFPYPAMQVSNSWHTQDGFFLHEKEGYSQVMFSSLLKSNVVKYTFFR